MKNKKDVLDSILMQGMLPLFFCENAEISLQTLRTLYQAGIRVLEYTNRGNEALENFKILKAAKQIEMADLFLGIGTIKTKQEAAAFIAAGADFIVSPIINPEVATLCHQQDMLWIPGCMTPTEIHLAQQNQAALIKIFPANILGPAFLSSIKELFPGQLFIPTGGVELDKNNIKEWFRAGVCAVGIGSKLISKKILNERLYEQLYMDTINTIELIKSCW